MSTVSDLISEHTLTAGATPRQIYLLKTHDDEGALLRLLKRLQEWSLEGHSVSFEIDGERFGFDGDGADKILDIEVQEGD